MDGVNGELRVLVDDAEWQARSLKPAPQDGNLGCGRELFAFMRNAMSSAEEGRLQLYREPQRLALILDRVDIRRRLAG